MQFSYFIDIFKLIIYLQEVYLKVSFYNISDVIYELQQNKIKIATFNCILKYKILKSLPSSILRSFYVLILKT